MQFFKIAVYMQVANCMAWYIMRFVHFCPYINGLRSALVGVADQAAYAVLGRVGIERARV